MGGMIGDQLGRQPVGRFYFGFLIPRIVSLVQRLRPSCSNERRDLPLFVEVNKWRSGNLT